MSDGGKAPPAAWRAVVPIRALALALVYCLGLIGVLPPYACGPAPVYFEIGYIARRDFWRLGLDFGLAYLGALPLVGLPYLLAAGS